MEQDDIIFEHYKPFRNQLANYETLDSLRIIWAYMRNYDRDYEFPEDIKVNFNSYEPLNNRRFKAIIEHELDFLSKEIIINTKNVSNKGKTLRNPKNIAKLINYLRRDLLEIIDARRKKHDEDFLLEYNRMAHHQFKWQQPYGWQMIIRYYKIFSHAQVSEMVLNALKFSLYDLYLLGVYFAGICYTDFLHSFPVKSLMKTISQETIDLFFANYASSLPKLRNEILQSREMNNKLFYTYNPLVESPIIIQNNTFFSPIPSNIIAQITNGTYYKITEQNNFNNAFGEAFENYIGEVLKAVCPGEIGVNWTPQFKYNKNNRRSSDFILHQAKALLFIECKTKRMTLASKVELDITQSLQQDLKKLATGVIQLYKQYMAYRENKYPAFRFEEGVAFYPVLLTLEEWYVTANPQLSELLDLQIRELFTAENLELKLLDDFPYYMMSTSEFEKQLQIICSIGIKEYFARWRENTLADLAGKFKYTPLFKDEFKSFFIDKLAVSEEEN